MRKLPIVELWGSVGFGAILSFPSGVLYANQTGGTACLHPTLEGIYIPLANDCTHPGGQLLGPEVELGAYFEGPKHGGTGAIRGLDSEDAAFIEMVLSRWNLSSFITLDRARLADSHEAWVWAIVTSDDGDDLPVFSGFGPYPRPAVLTWSNSD